jgi:hypothetical protein
MRDESRYREWFEHPTTVDFIVRNVWRLEGLSTNVSTYRCRPRLINGLSLKCG